MREKQPEASGKIQTNLVMRRGGGGAVREEKKREGAKRIPRNLKTKGIKRPRDSVSKMAEVI